MSNRKPDLAALGERARSRYPQLDPELLDRLAATASESVAERQLPDDRARQIAAHVTLAQLVGSHLADAESESLLQSASARTGDHTERALGEHLHAWLEPEELLVAALRADRLVERRAAAAALNLTVDELSELELSARAKASDMTVAYHAELICEPAALSAADSPSAASAAVRAHLATCRSCRREFDERVWSVVAEAGALVRQMPPLVAAGRRSRPVRVGRRLVRLPA